MSSLQPYITKAYFSLPSPPTKLVKIAIGDGAIGIGSEFTDAPVVEIIETFPQLIGYDSKVFNYFATQYVSNIIRPTFWAMLT
jgi:carboxypeptidase D